jgi:transmembrane sensor
MTDESRLGPPPIEPLSDTAWSRVERGLWSQLDAEPGARRAPEPPRRWAWVVAPLAAAAAVAALVFALRLRPAAVDEPSRIVSGPAPSSVQFGDSHIELDASTALTLRHEAEHPTVMLERGGAWFTVAPRHARPAFLVRAGDATVEVVGTRFRVARSDERIAVEVERGRVDVEFRGGMVAVGPGQRWSSDAPSQIVTAAASPAAAAAPESAPEPSAAPEPEPAPAPGPPARKHNPRATHPAGSTSATDARPGAAEATDAADRAEYDRLAALEPRSPDAALAGYLALARGTSRWAAPALFAAGRLAHDRGDRRAESLLTLYLQRFPDGANAVDARELLNRLRAGQP